MHMKLQNTTGPGVGVCVCIYIYKHIGEKARFPRLSGREGCTRDTVILYCAGRFVEFRGKIPCTEERFI